MLISPAAVGALIYLQIFFASVRAGFPSSADNCLDASIDLSRW